MKYVDIIWGFWNLRVLRSFLCIFVVVKLSACIFDELEVFQKFLDRKGATYKQETHNLLTGNKQLQMEKRQQTTEGEGKSSSSPKTQTLKL